MNKTKMYQACSYAFACKDHKKDKDSSKALCLLNPPPPSALLIHSLSSCLILLENLSHSYSENYAINEMFVIKISNKTEI